MTPPRDTPPSTLVRMHVLGRDYLVLDRQRLEPEVARRLCRGFGRASVRAVIAPVLTLEADVGMRALDPKGAEVALSPDCVLAFAAYAWRGGLVGKPTFRVWTYGGIATVRAPEASGEGSPGIVELESPWVDPQVERVHLPDGTVNARTVHLGVPYTVARVPEGVEAAAAARALREHLHLGMSVPLVMFRPRGAAAAEAWVDPPEAVTPGTLACLVVGALGAKVADSGYSVGTDAGEVRVGRGRHGAVAVAAAVIAEECSWRDAADD